MGVWLGDGQAICDTNWSDSLNESWSDFANPTQMASDLQSDTNTTVQKRQLHSLNQFSNKHIPLNYICNSRQNRLKLLAGLLDSSGQYLEQSNGFELTQNNFELAQQIKYLADTLGFRTSLNTKKATKNVGFESEVYAVQIEGDIEIIPVRVERKKARLRQSEIDWRATGIEVKFDCFDDYYGFEIDGNHLFLLEDMTVTHNTAFVVSSLRNAAVDFNMPVAIFSLEMSSIQLVNRMISSEAEIDGEKLKKGNLAPHEWTQLHQRIDKLMRAPIYIDDTPALSILELRAKSRRLKQQHDIQMIVIDYLQLMQGDTKGFGGNREQEIASISRALKNLAKELNVPVIALSQLSRAVETRGGDKRPQLSDLRESGSIEQDADVVAFLYRPDYYGFTEDEAGNSVQGIGEVILAKNRSGSLETVQLRFIGKYTKFTDLDSYYSPSANAPGSFNNPPAANQSFDNSASQPPPAGTGVFRSKANDMGPMDFPPPDPEEKPPF